MKKFGLWLRGVFGSGAPTPTPTPTPTPMVIGMESREKKPRRFERRNWLRLLSHLLIVAGLLKPFLASVQGDGSCGREALQRLTEFLKHTHALTHSCMDSHTHPRAPTHSERGSLTPHLRRLHTEKINSDYVSSGGLCFEVHVNVQPTELIAYEYFKDKSN